MSRVTTRASRGLIAGLAIILVFGLVAVLHKLPKSIAAAPPALRAQNAPEANDSAKPAKVLLAAATQAARGEPVEPARGEPVELAITSTPIYADNTAAPTTAPAPTVAPTPLHATSPVTSTSNALADGRAKIDAGDLLAGRDVLNAALLANAFSDADATAAKQLMAKANQDIIFSSQRFPNDPTQFAYTVQPGEKPGRLAANNDLTWEIIGRINNIPDARKLRSGVTLKLFHGPFHAVVTKSKFTLDIYLGSPGEKGSVYVETLGVGLGKDDSTPTGIWMIDEKLKHPTYYSPRGAGEIAADDPKNPLGPCWIALTGTDGQAVGKTSYGIHGTIEPDSIGKQSSMGCIRMHNEDAMMVYDLLVKGRSTVIVKD